MADTPQLKVIKDLTAAQKLTNENLLKINESIKAQMSGIVDAVKEPPKKDIEEIKEKKSENKKFLDSLKGIFKSSGAGGGESLMGGIKKMMSKYKKIIMTLLGVGLVGFFSMFDMKQLGQLWKSFKEVLVAIKDFLVPIIIGIAKWTKSTFLPETFKFFLRQLDNVKELFTDLSKTFSGWTDKTPMEKFTTILDAFTDIGGFVGKTALNLITWGEKLLGGDGSLSKGIKAQWEKWFGGGDEGEGGSNFLSKVGGVLAALVGMFTVGKILPFGLGKVLMLPLQLAIKVAILGAKGTLGLAGHLAKGIGGVMTKIPLTGAGSLAKTLMGVAGKVGILGLAFAVGKGFYDGAKEFKETGNIRKAYDKGLSSFFTVMTLGLLPTGMADSWAKSINNFFGGVYDAMFGEDKIELTKQQIEQRRRTGTGGDIVQSEEVRKQKLDEALRKAGIGGAGEIIKQKRSREERLEENERTLKNKINEIGRIELLKLEKGDKFSKKSQANLDRLKEEKETLKDVNEQIKAEKKKKVLDNLPTITTKSDLVNMAKGQTREESWTGQSEFAKHKMNIMGSMFKGGIRVTSGFRDPDRGDEAMKKLSSDHFMKNYGKYMKGSGLDAGEAGSEERELAITQIRNAGFSSQHEHGNAIDFSYPSGYSKENFSELKGKILGTFPGANLIKEKDHLHMAFDRKTTGVQLASLEGEQKQLQGQVGTGGDAGGGNQFNQINNNNSSESFMVAENVRDKNVPESHAKG